MNNDESISCQTEFSNLTHCEIDSTQGEIMQSSESEKELSHEEIEASNEAPENSPYLEGLMKDLNQVSDAEGKLHKVIAFMEQALSQTGRPHFKSFWQARGLCIPLFKEESLSPTARAELWNKYTELSKTARRLKDHFDEQSAYAVEQIEIAINALDTGINSLEQNRDQIEEHEFALPCASLDAHLPFYRKTQGELNLLNVQASRINSLRKELVNTGMPSRKKNKFFHRLSQLGDKVFPRRKELIQLLSDRFTADVDSFIKRYFEKSELQGQLFFLREEIKNLQSAAKLLTLNTQAFTHTRLCLSECWDKVKQEDKERKKERMQLKTVFKQNFESVLAKIEECSQAIAGGLSPAESLKKIDEVSAIMRTVQLGKQEVHELRSRLDELRKPIVDQRKAAEQLRLDQEFERQQQKERHVIELKEAIKNLLKNGSSMSLEQLNAERDTLLETIQSSQITRAEKMDLERLLKPLRDIFLEKKASALKNLSENDRQSLEQLKDFLNERKELRHEVKEQLEALRRAVGSSGLDFEKAMEYNAQILSQKERLEKINQGIKEVEEQIANVENKLY